MHSSRSTRKRLRAAKNMSTPPQPAAPRVCLVGMNNLGVLAPQFRNLPVGGAELQQTLLARALVRRGVSVSMIVADHGQAEGAVWDGVKTYKAFRPQAGLPVLRFVYPRWTGLWRALRRADADVYYTSCAGAQLGQVVLFAHRHRRRVVFRIASLSDCDPRSVLVRYARDRILYRYGLEHADLVLAQTREQQQALREHYGRDSEVVASLADATPLQRRPFDARDIDVLWVGNLRSLKRPDRLLAAARRLPQLKFHMIGGPMPGAERLFESVRIEALTLPNLTFHGAVPPAEIGAFFARSRVLAATSQIEGFPNSFLQAWAAGTPVVSFLDPEGLLEREVLGYQVTDVDSLCSRLLELGTHREAWERLSHRAHAHMCERSAQDPVQPYLEALGGLRPAAALARAWA